MEQHRMTIVVCRHPDRMNDMVTELGGMQAIKLARYLEDKGLTPDRVQHSGAGRTRQAANFMSIAISAYDLTPQENRDFHFMDVIKSLSGLNIESIGENHDKIEADGNTVRAALAHNVYARRIRDYLALALQKLCQEMEERNEKCAWVVSHGYFAELAVPNIIRGEVPYGIGFSDAIIYTMGRSEDDCEIIKAEYLPFDSIEKKELEDEDED